MPMCVLLKAFLDLDEFDLIVSRFFFYLGSVAFVLISNDHFVFSAMEK